MRWLLRTPVVALLALGGLAACARQSVSRAQPGWRYFGDGLSVAEQQQAVKWLDEVATLCEQDGGRLWGVSLCGPIAIVNPATRLVATNRPSPDAPRPQGFGYANTAVEWGGERWTTVVWQQMIAADELGYGASALVMHELFHRIQPQLGFLLPDSLASHLDTFDGRYWLQLEWRALDQALLASGEARSTAVRDALAFRAARRNLIAGAAEREHHTEISEGLAEYTAVATALPTTPEAMLGRARGRLRLYLQQTTLVRAFGYGSGAAYGALLETWKPGWTREFRVTDDLGAVLMRASGLLPTADLEAAAARHGGAELRAAEQAREAERLARVQELRQRFVNGPVLILPRPTRFTFGGDVTPVGTEGSLYLNVRADADWGGLVAEEVLLSADGATMRVPAPTTVSAARLAGAGWTLVPASGWGIEFATRPGDLRLVRQSEP